MKGPGHRIGIIGEWGKNAKRYSIPYGWSMCNSNDTGRKKNLELEFKAELCVSCVLPGM